MTDETTGGGETLPPGWDREAFMEEFMNEVLAPAETPEARGWPYYEARLSIHVRPSKPTDAFGEGGDELAHARAWTQAPSFPEAVERLNADLGVKWTQVQSNAALVDMPPSPDVLAREPGFLSAVVSLPQWVLVLNLLMWVAFFVAFR